MKPLAFAAILLAAVIGAKAQIRPPPSIEPLFNVTINLDPDVIGPLSVPGGLQTVTRMLNGTITGALEATITGGIAFSIDYNGTGLALGSHVWGVTDDGQEFFATDTGTGVGERTFNQVAISVGGKYVNLTQEYIIASASQLDERTVFSQAFVLR